MGLVQKFVMIRLTDGGIVCFSYDAHQANLQPLPPPEGNIRIETGNWYFIKAAELPNSDNVGFIDRDIFATRLIILVFLYQVTNVEHLVGISIISSRIVREV